MAAAAWGVWTGGPCWCPSFYPGRSYGWKWNGKGPVCWKPGCPKLSPPPPNAPQPPCPYFGRCGGCHYQHATYEAQLARKLEVLREVFQRVGKQEAPGEIDVISASPWEYRNRAQFHVAGGEAGYLEAGSNRLCPVDRCPICSPAINQALATLRGMIRDNRFPRFVRSVELFTNESEVQLNVLEADRLVAKRFFEWCAEGMPGAAAGSLDYGAAGQLYRVSHRSFFQVNRFLIDSMVERALEGAEGETAVDLYAGVGLFSLPLARRFQSVTAVESVGRRSPGSRVQRRPRVA